MCQTVPDTELLNACRQVILDYMFGIGMNEWRDDIRVLMRKAGVNGVDTVFLFGDHQIKEEAFLEDVNMILNSGDIPNLYENEERLEIIEKVRVHLIAAVHN